MMIDQCKNCTFLGDFEKCKTTPCSHHKTWYAETLRGKLLASEQRAKFVENVNAIQEQFVCNTIGKAIGFPQGPDSGDTCCGGNVLESLS